MPQFNNNNAYKPPINKIPMGEREYQKGDGNLPTLSARGETIAEAWENSVVELYNHGLWYPRQGEKDEGRLQLDSTMGITIQAPEGHSPLEGYYHKFLECDWGSLVGYQMELLGLKNSFVDSTGESTRWEYGYHERFEDYHGKDGPVNQIAGVIERLATKPHKRNIQMITWVPGFDLTNPNPPCLQRVWFELIPDELAGDGSRRLNMNYSFRSRNVMHAAPMNMIGLATFHEFIRQGLVEKTDWNVKPGRMHDFVDTYHTSSRDMRNLGPFMELYNRSITNGQTIKDRVLDLATVLEMLEEEAPIIVEKVKEQMKRYIPAERVPYECERADRIYEFVTALNRRVAAGISN
jgi:thymidylate synthase